MANPIGPLPSLRGPRVRLVVAEKPSVARDMAQLLGIRERLGVAYVSPSLWIVSCIGHMAELAPPEHYTGRWRAWRFEALPMVPERFALVAARRNESHWHALKAWLRHKRVAELINACDAGREGELIFRYVYELAGCTQPCQRLWLQALTGPAVRRAFDSLEPSKRYDGLADAARCRAEADWLVGLNGTRAMTLLRREGDGQGALSSVGRVQTPTLAMIIAREEAIEQFVAEAYWEVTAHAPALPEALFRVIAPPAQRLREDNAPVGAIGKAPSPLGQHRFATEASAQAAAQAVTDAHASVESFSAEQEVVWPPTLFDLTALQREANVRYGMKAADTLAAAQILYETEKAITYPRTDSRYLPQALQPGLEALTRRLTRGPLSDVAAQAQRIIDPQGIARLIRDEAVTDHHAIVPTGQPPKSDPHSAAGKIYALIVRRFLAAQSPPARAGVSQMTLRANGFLLLARGRSVVIEGWQAIEPPARRTGDAPPLPPSNKGAPVALGPSRLHAQKTQPPPRLNEAMLLLAMERAGRRPQGGAAQATAGLGTPATRASIIETLKSRGYIRVEGRSLVPTPTGRALCRTLPNEALKSAQLTSAWETRLSSVAKGLESREAFMRDIARFVEKLVGDIAQAAGKKGGSQPPTAQPTAQRPSRPSKFAGRSPASTRSDA